MLTDLLSFFLPRSFHSSHRKTDIRWVCWPTKIDVFVFYCWQRLKVLREMLIHINYRCVSSSSSEKHSLFEIKNVSLSLSWWTIASHFCSTCHSDASLIASCTFIDIVREEKRRRRRRYLYGWYRWSMQVKKSNVMPGRCLTIWIIISFDRPLTMWMSLPPIG